MLYGNVVAAVLTFSVSVFGLGAEYRWQPVDATGVGAFWIDDQEVLGPSKAGIHVGDQLVSSRRNSYPHC